MKNKAKFFLSILLLLSLFPLNADEWKWYSDWNTGYCGYASASFIGTTKTVNPETDAAIIELAYRSYDMVSFLYHPKKLSKQQTFLLESALRQFDFSDNEVYCVMIAEREEMLIIVAVISGDEQNYEWYSAGLWSVPGGIY